MNFKYDGTLLESTNIEDTDDIGMSAWTHQVDNSGDVIIPCNKQLPVQTYVARFENADDLDEDSTKQALVTTSFSNAAYAIHNTQEFKFGAGALKFSGGPAYMKAAEHGITTNWTVSAWSYMEPSHAANNPKVEMFTIDDATGNSLIVTVDGNVSSPNLGKIEMTIAPQGGGGSTTASVGSTYWTAMGSSSFHHWGIVKEEPTLGSYKYSVYFDGTQVCTATVVTNIGLNDVYVGANKTTPATGNSLLGTIDDFVIDPNSVWSGTFTLPTERYRITSTDSRVNIIKFDRQHDKR